MTRDARVTIGAVAYDPKVVTIPKGHDAVQELVADMHASRLERLAHAGFTDEPAHLISNLHTPNFM